jgi:hypothetical protein
MEVFKSFISVMHFLKPINMQQQMKNFIKDWSMYLSKLHNLICINAQLGLKNQRKIDKNGTKLVQTQTFQK